MRKRKTTWNGVEYPSLREAAKALGVTYDVLQNRLRKGYNCDTDLNRPKPKKYQKKSKSQARL